MGRLASLTIPIDAVAHLKAEGKLGVRPLLGTYFIRVNTSDSKSPLSDVSMRLALFNALNRENLSEHLLQGGQKPAYTLTPPELNLSKQMHKASLADTFYREINHKDPIVLSFSSSERNASIAQTLQKQWEEALGITVILEAIEPKVYYERISQNQFQLAMGSWIADFNDPINFLEVFKYKDTSTNHTGWESSKYIDLLNRSGLCQSQDERTQILAEAEEILMEHMPIIPIFHFAMNYLQRKELKDVVLSPIGQIDFRWAHFEAEKPSRTQ